MSSEYVMAVTNGSRLCNMGLFSTDDERNTDEMIRISYAMYGPRFFWLSCPGRMDLEDILAMCQKESLPLYFLDGEQLTMYRDNVWTDFPPIEEIEGN